MTQVLPLAQWLSDQRPDSLPVAWRGDQLWTLADLRRDVQGLSQQLAQQAVSRWALCFEDSYWFVVALLAVLHGGKTPVLPGHCRAAQLRAQCQWFEGVLSDQALACGLPLIQLGAKALCPVSDAPLAAVPAQSVVELFTSGSSGQPCRVVKPLACLDLEARLLAAHFAGRLAGCRFVASVMPQHQYGLTFRIMLPMAIGQALHAAMSYYPEQLCALDRRYRYVFVSSPAFLKRLDSGLSPPAISMVLSAGSTLDGQAVARVQRWCAVAPDEIYGSTETGVLAFRDTGQPDSPWRPFAGVRLCRQAEGWRAASPLIADASGLLLDDELQMLDNGCFYLSGRRGRVVKIEEKRVSLDEVERLLLALDGVIDAAALMVNRGKRQAIAVLLVLSDKRLSVSQSQIWAWRRALLRWLDPVALPRYWRVVSAIPVNSMNKRVSAQLEALFLTSQGEQNEPAIGT